MIAPAINGAIAGGTTAPMFMMPRSLARLSLPIHVSKAAAGTITSKAGRLARRPDSMLAITLRGPWPPIERMPVGAKEQSAPSHAELGGAHRRLLYSGVPSLWGPSARHRHRIGSPDDRITVGRLSKTPVSME